MLGLSLAIRVGKRVLGGLIDSLMSAIKGRATYSENIADSKQVLKDIDNYELLDKASILLTPTAYSDARVHSVKTYTGDELVTNGGFDTDSDWTLDTGWSIEDGVVKGDDASFDFITQSISGLRDKTIKVTFEIKDWVSGTFRVPPADRADGLDERYSGNGTYQVIYTSNLDLFRFQQQAFDGSIDNVSVLDVSSDFDFDRASSATRINSDGLVQDMQSITDPELVQNGDFEELGDDLVTNGTFDADSDWSLTQATITDGSLNLSTSDGSYTAATQTLGTIGNVYKISLDVSDIVGTISVAIGGGTDVDITTNGTHTVYITSASTTFEVKRKFGITNVSATIDNVSVQQVDPNDRWSIQNNTGTDTEITSGNLKIETDGAYTEASQSSILVGGNQYELIYTILSSDNGDLGLVTDGNVTVSIPSSVGTHTYYFTAHSTSFVLKRRGGALNATIDNISVKDITFSEDVDLARINYDSNGENGHWLLEPTSTNEITYSEDFSQTIWTKNDVLVEGGYTAPDGSNTAYKVTNDGGNAHLVGYYNINTGKRKSIWAKTVSGTGDVDLLNQNGNNLFTLTNEWQRFDATHAGAANFFYAVDFRGASTTLSEVIVWGCQLEDLSYATSYIPTYGSTVTRATETLTGSGNSTLINSTEGVLYAEIAALADDGTFRVVSINSGDNTNVVKIGYRTTSNAIYYEVRSGDVSQSFQIYTTTDVKEFHKVALLYKENDFKLFVNGVNVLSDTSGITPIGLNNLSFEVNSGAYLYGKVKALAVFDEALTDDELELLTGITNYGSFNELAQANGYTII